MLEKFFKLKENNTTVKTEVLAGITTFMTMAYILIVNPNILSLTGMDKGALFTATAISSIIATLIMALYANLPFALAPGMGLNAFFTYTIVFDMGYSWQFALTAVLIEGIIFILLTLLNVREYIINCIPKSVKNAISVGIGLFIALIGLEGAGLIQSGKFITPDNTLGGLTVTLGNIKTPATLLSIFGLIFISFLLAKKVKGALLIGIFTTTILGIFVKVTDVSGLKNLFSSPIIPSISPIFMKFDFSKLFTFDMFLVLFTLLFVDMFDTVGTLIGVSTKSKMIGEDGKIPRVKQALFADSIGTTVGALLGTSTVTTYVESASGVAEGGRTGLTALSTAIMFLLALFLAPLFLIVPSAATAPVLILVGLFMMSPIKDIDFEDYTESIPAFLTLVMMPLSFSIANGIIFGVVSYVLIKILTGKFKDIPILTYFLALLFIIKFILE